MKQKVKFELIQPLMCGGIRIAENFLESEPFIRGSVLRAAFANLILLECPLADQVTSDGKHNYIELKDPDGRCMDCPRRNICEKFGEMTFSFAYPDDSFPAPLTAKQCKKCGTTHPIKDILVEDTELHCDKHENSDAAARRMENLKGMICMKGTDVNTVEKKKVNMTLSTHTSINYNSHTADDGSLYSVKAISRGQEFTAVIDDCGTGMICLGNVVYVGKYNSCGFGKMKIKELLPVHETSEAEIKARIENFNRRFTEDNLVSVLFMSDAYPYEMPEASKVMTNEEYLNYWTKALFCDEKLPFTVKKIFTEAQLYSGYDTSKSWNNWKKEQPELIIAKGTSLLLKINEGCMDEAVEKLAALCKYGVGKQTENGFGQIEICHPIHCIGVKNNE